ncbi:MAG TPA: hypothetical protein VHD62_09670 [Opitutaceae bacterium]|nr:hypothetical protein [Opitutaceae bacterium]
MLPSVGVRSQQRELCLPRRIQVERIKIRFVHGRTSDVRQRTRRKKFVRCRHAGVGARAAGKQKNGAAGEGDAVETERNE